jgi:hypothetical protein
VARNSFTVSAGDSVTVSGAGLRFAGGPLPAFPPDARFDAVLIDDLGGALSNETTISTAPLPLPAGGLLLLSALGAAIALRRRNA